MSFVAPLLQQGSGLKLRPYQQEAVNKLIESLFTDKETKPLIVLPTGCHARGTLILMHDGTTKPVEAVQIGDLLMGPDSQPRRVLRLARGREPMRRIVPIKGEPFVVNEGHILSLATTNEGKKFASNMDGSRIDNISVREWETKSAYWKHLRKLRKVAIDFAPRSAPIIDPWVMGCLLADGCLAHGMVSISKPDPEILSGVENEMRRLGIDSVRKVENPRGTCWQYYFANTESNRSIPNPITKILRDVGVMDCDAGSKFIPDDYKLGSRETRLNVLAGLLDGDGHLDAGGVFDYISKSKQLSDDLVFVARSLGLRAHCVPSEKYAQNGTGGIYWRACVSGDLDMIPNRVPRKQADERKQKKNPLVTGFSVEKMPEDDFYGFTLDGDHLYLTADFFVHHNTGKSLVIAEFCRYMLTNYPHCRIFVMVNSQELVGQNAEEMLGIWPSAPLGIHNAGLGQWDIKSPLIFGSIQSMHKKAYKFQQCDIILVDEAQNIPRKSDTMWQNFIRDINEINGGKVRFCGLTATPFRMDSGRLDSGKGRMFTDIVYSYPIVEAIEEGYLTQPFSDDKVAQINTSGIGVRGGDFIPNDLEAVAADPSTVDAVVKEMLRRGQDRAGWIVFGTGVKHCMMMREAFLDNGISCEGVFAKEPENYVGNKYDRKKFVKDYKDKKIRCLVSMNALTVGFNAKHADLLGFARPTKSVNLWVQGVGRVTRPLYANGFDLSTREGRLLAIANGPKPNALVLDFGRNTERHGPIDKPNVKEPGQGDGTMPMKACPQCGTDNFIAARVCRECGNPFPVEGAKISVNAATGPLLTSQTQQPEWVDVDEVTYKFYQKTGSLPTCMVTYHCGLLSHNEWICFEHDKTHLARINAVKWWRKRALTAELNPVPTTVAEALERLGELRKPSQIQVIPDGKYTKVVGVLF